jgi:hypothetical protein
LKFDESLTSEEAKKELNFLAGNSESEENNKKKKEEGGEPEDEEEEDERNEVEKLYDEGKFNSFLYQLDYLFSFYI